MCPSIGCRFAEAQATPVNSYQTVYTVWSTVEGFTISVVGVIYRQLQEVCKNRALGRPSFLFAMATTSLMLRLLCAPYVPLALTLHLAGGAEIHSSPAREG